MTTDQTLHNDYPAADFILSGDPNKAMQQMMQTIDTLRDIYVEENQALGQADTKRFLALQDRKITEARRYQVGARQLLERKSDLVHIDEALKQELAGRQEEFSGIMSENLKALDRFRRSIDRLNDRVMTTAREAVQAKNVPYGAGGNLHKNERPVSLGLSEEA